MEQKILQQMSSNSSSKDKEVDSTSLPVVFFVGGPDVDARLDLMHCLKDSFNVSAVGSHPTLHDKFLAEGFEYNAYHLNRRVNPLSDLLTLAQLASIFRKLRPEIVHTFDTKPGVWGCLAAGLAGVPVIIGTLTGLGPPYGSNSLKTKLIGLVYQQLQTLACKISDLTIFQNHDDARQFTAASIVSKQKTKVILGSGVSTELFTPDRVSELERAQLREELGIQPDEIVVTMVSRVIRSKGVFEFMAAAQNVSVDYPKVRFLLIGSEDKDSIDALSAAELNELKQSVIWPGSRRDIPVVLALSDIFVFPSAYPEGIPRVLLEAASMGLAIVTTDSPGCKEVVENGINGFLVPISDAAALSQSIVHLIEQPELRQSFGQVSRQRAVERFDLLVIANQTRSVYQQLLAYKGLAASGHNNEQST